MPLKRERQYRELEAYLHHQRNFSYEEIDAFFADNRNWAWIARMIVMNAERDERAARDVSAAPRVPAIAKPIGDVFEPSIAEPLLQWRSSNGSQLRRFGDMINHKRAVIAAIPGIDNDPVKMRKIDTALAARSLSFKT